MDYAAKMKELEELWQDSFDLCKAMIDACKAGDLKLNASLLKAGFQPQTSKFNCGMRRKMHPQICSQV